MELGIRAPDQAALDTFEQYWGAPAAGVLGFGDASTPAASVARVTADAPMFAAMDRPVNWAIPLAWNGISMADVAAGKYDSYFQQMAATISANSSQATDPNIYVRIGWEATNSYPWKVQVGANKTFSDSLAADYVAAFKHVADIFRAADSRVKIEWNQNYSNQDVNRNYYDLTKLYPGDDYVDVVAVDMYNVSKYSGQDNPVTAWSYKLNAPYGLNWFANFATDHSKPLAITEFGIDADNFQYYVQKLTQFMADNNVIYANYWNQNAGGNGNDTLTDGSKPSTAAAFLTYFAGQERALTLTGGDATNDTLIGGIYGDTISGLAGNDTLTGNAGNDTLDGGAGADTMAGGTGDDIYYVDNVGDKVTENAGEGTDTVRSTIAYTLGANVENLDLLGTGDIAGTGNALDNVITGNSGNNALQGFGGNDRLIGGAGNDTLDGGAGADTMIGGTGDDIYYVDNSGDVVTENAGEGIDTVRTGYTYALPANVENLQLLYAGNAFGTGNALDNVITGNTGNNTLYGLAGNDTLLGGAGADTLYGGVGDDYLDGGTGADTMVGGTGNDSYYVDDAGDVVVENAGEGTDTVRSTIAYTLGANVENLDLLGTADSAGAGNALDNVITGNSGNNLLQGFDGNDTLSGGAGNDTLDGGTGADTMAGGTGDDIYYVDDSGDVVIENAGEGTDTVRSTIAYTLGADVENLGLLGTGDITGTGNALDNVITGNSGNNTLYGLAGNDTLDGGAGADTMIGGTGDDIYYVDDAGDTIIENGNEGTDTVRSTIAYTLGANLENLDLLGTGDIAGTGNAYDNVITGNSGNNALQGFGGNDTLIGGAGNDTIDGGPGADTMIGGTGDDIYYVDNSGDVVTENTGEGIDTVRTGFTYTLGANVENLQLLYSGNAWGTGNALDNILTGNSGNNNLYGLAGNDTLTGNAGNDTLDGGAGADTMAGGTGDDIYYVDNVGDKVTENAGEGTDTVRSTIAYTLGANVENLDLLGTGDIAGTGNALDNVITGNSGNNALQGFGGNDRLIGGAGNDTLDGGAGADTMIGGTGDDIYYVDNSGDVVTENAGEGIDTVRTGYTYTLGANVENLQMLYTGNAWGTGNALDNVITGNPGNNTIKGLDGNDTLNGGGGFDTLYGGAGQDVFAFTAALNPTVNLATIADFSPQNDQIALDHTVFAGLSVGALLSTSFASTTAPEPTSAAILYDGQTGKLYFDADGAGGNDPLQFATLSGAPAIGAGSFRVT